MPQEQGFDTDVSPERKEMPTVIFVGRLEDLGLGNSDGIPSKLAEATPDELDQFGEELLESSKAVTDTAHDGCIDGRCVLSNADGSSPQVRERHVGGSAANLEIAMNAGAPVLDTVPEGASLEEVSNVIDEYVAQKSGKQRAAHTEGCGGANGAIMHNELIGTDSAPLAATQALMEIPQVVKMLGVTYSEELAEAVRDQAPKTAAWLGANRWSGQAYVDMVAKREPAGVEELQGGDDEFHGHAEDALVIDLRTGEVVARDDVFVVSISAIKKKAEALAGERGEVGYTQALIADIAKHMAVAKVLPSTKTPVFLIG